MRQTVSDWHGQNVPERRKISPSRLVAFAGPEMLDLDSIYDTENCDVYSFGCLVYTLLQDSVPMNAASWVRVLV